MMHRRATNGRFRNVVKQPGYVALDFEIWRPTTSELQKQLEGTVLQNATGILIWRDFTIAKN